MVATSSARAKSARLKTAPAAAEKKLKAVAKTTVEAEDVVEPSSGKPVTVKTKATAKAKAPKTAATKKSTSKAPPKAKAATKANALPEPDAVLDDASLPAEAAPLAKRKAVRLTASKPRALVQRVYDTIDVELTKLENQTGQSSQDRERASRALSQMVNSLEKAVEMQREITKHTSAGSGAKDKEALRHAEDLRREIAERLERLNRRRALGKRSE